MDRVIAHAIVGAAATAVVRQAVPGAGFGPTVVAAAIAVVLHEAFDAPLAARLHNLGI